MQLLRYLSQNKVAEPALQRKIISEYQNSESDRKARVQDEKSAKRKPDGSGSGPTNRPVPVSAASLSTLSPQHLIELRERMLAPVATTTQRTPSPSTSLSPHSSSSLSTTRSQSSLTLPQGIQALDTSQMVRFSAVASFVVVWCRVGCVGVGEVVYFAWSYSDH